MLGRQEIDWEAFRTLHEVLSELRIMINEVHRAEVMDQKATIPEQIRVALVALETLGSKKRRSKPPFSRETLASYLDNSDYINLRDTLTNYFDDYDLMNLVLKKSSDRERPYFEEMVPWILRLRCSDIRDRIFGLIDAVKWDVEGRTPIVDYGKTALHLALEVAALVMARNSLSSSEFVGHLLKALNVDVDGYATVGLDHLLDRRKVSCQNSRNKIRAPNGECTCSVPVSHCRSRMFTQLTTGLVITADELDVEVIMPHKSSLWLLTAKESPKSPLGKTGSYACSFTSSASHRYTRHSSDPSYKTLAICGSNIRKGDLIVELSSDTKYIPDRGYRACLVIRPFAKAVYEIVSHIVIWEGHRTVSPYATPWEMSSPAAVSTSRTLIKRPIKRNESDFVCAQKSLTERVFDLGLQVPRHYEANPVFILAADPEDVVLFDLLYCQTSARTDVPRGANSRLYRGLRDSFCQTRFSSFFFTEDLEKDSSFIPPICADCGGALRDENRAPT